MAAKASPLDGPNVFLVMLSGEIASIDLPSDNLYCKYTLVYGPDWAMCAGLEEGISQTANRRAGQDAAVLNFPLEATLKSTNPFGWPQLQVAVYGSDLFGRDVVRGYGSVHLPLTAGRHELSVPLFTPQDKSVMQSIIGYIYGKRPEYVDPTIVARNAGREGEAYMCKEQSNASARGFFCM
eukprot:TRINITY_DN12165_c0_g1_i10.p2 TRINITY_DN12165_c0_g1~~TRINITY_DN12165_c0_g1_i10.p2  ORF type:complete len:181 (+),score=15.57 TRINITY_DN12165_c0_g1_i10:2227-2769(+)